MKDITHLGTILFFLAVFGNLLWFILKIICNRKGYPISLFVNHQWDIKNTIEIIKNENSAPAKIIYITILLLLFLSLGAFFVFAFIFLLYS